MSGHGQDDATTDATTITRWWRETPRANVGISCARSGLYVVDLDCHEDAPGFESWAELTADQDVPATYTVRTPSGGEHLYFAMPDPPLRNTAGKLGAGIDTRGNGYVVAAGSVIGRQRYAVVDPSPIAELPAWIIDALTPRPHLPAWIPTQGACLATYDEVVQRVMDLSQELADAPVGQGNHAAARLAFMAGQYAGADQIDPVLVIDIMMGAISDWTYNSPTGYRRMEKTVVRQVSHGARSPRPWTGARFRGPTDEVIPVTAVAVEAPRVDALTLDAAHAIFVRWLGDEYDLSALDVVLAAAAVERLGGDPVWLLLISGSGNAKTETVAALQGAGAWITSTITSEGALLSATANKDKSVAATGGLLRKIGAAGIVVIKDFTSIISMNREVRAAVLGALREVYDGKWERNVGTDGGRTLTWEGRLVLIGACTTAYDSAHAVIASMGDRFALVRMDSTTGRQAAGRQALRNVDREVEMRAELAQAAAGVLAGADASRAELSPNVMDRLLQAADLVTMARTAVECDYQGDPMEAHAPEMPTRFAKMLGQIVRGGLAIGMSEDLALASALRVARDSIPPMRLAALEYIRSHPGQSTRGVSKGMGKPHKTTDRCLQALELIGLLCKDDGVGQAWQWYGTDLIDPEAYALVGGVCRERQ